MLLPALSYELWLTSKDIEPLDRRRAILSHYIGQREP
jgi:hypothetical protein